MFLLSFNNGEDNKTIEIVDYFFDKREKNRYLYFQTEYCELTEWYFLDTRIYQSPVKIISI